MILINIFKFRPQKICVNHIYFEDLHTMIKTLHSYDHKDEIHIYILMHLTKLNFLHMVKSLQ